MDPLTETGHLLNLIVVEDEPLFRGLLTIALSQEDRLRVVGAFADAESALEACLQLKPDVAILDIELPGMNGIQLGLHLRKSLPHLGIVLLSNHQDPAYLTAIPASSVAGWSYLLKKSVSDVAALHRAVEGAANGLMVVDSHLAAENAPRYGSIYAHLTPRQKEILSLIAQGYSNGAIAEKLSLATKSVENHINQLYQQLGIDTNDPHVQPRVTAVLTYLQETRPNNLVPFSPK